jgi:membrane-anchored glycerophosphoryl diester phosphodiesterase (GDPDase)
MNEFGATNQERAYIPMTFSQSLDRIWKILCGRYRLFLQLGSVPAAAFFAIYAIIFGVLFAFGVFPPHGAPDPQRMARVIIPAIALTTLPMVIAYAVFEAAACSATLAINRGGETSFRVAYDVAWTRLGRIAWLMILRWVCIALPIMAVLGTWFGAGALAFFTGVGKAHPGVLFVLIPFVVLSYLASIVYAVWMALRLGLAVPACLAEDTTAMQAVKRSARLTRGAVGRIFIVMLVVYAISYAAMFVFEMAAMAVSLLGTLLGSAMHAHLGQPWVVVGLSLFGLAALVGFLAMMALSWSSYSIAFTVLYDDQRLRQEGAARMVVCGGPTA